MEKGVLEGQRQGALVGGIMGRDLEMVQTGVSVIRGSRVKY